MAKIEFSMGELTDGQYPFLITVAVQRSWYNKMRFWLFFRFFPFQFRRWIE